MRYTALNPLFHELFSETYLSMSLLPNITLSSQSSFSWAFLWNRDRGYLVTEGITTRALNPLFHELFSETWQKSSYIYQRSTTLNPLFHELFSETCYGLETLGLWLEGGSQSSFSWAFLWNVGERSRLRSGEQNRLSILFFMSFSLKLERLVLSMVPHRWDSQSSFSWAFLWNRCFSYMPSDSSTYK